MSLLQRARAKDEASWQRIVYLYSPLLYSWCRRYGLQDADTLDVSQDVFRSVFLHLDGFRKERPGDSFRKWLKTITRNRVLDAVRRAGRTPASLGVSDAPDLAAESSLFEEVDNDPAEQESERRIVLRRALEMVRTEFEPRTWDAFWRVTVEETPAADVALALGVSANVVYLSKSRVLRRLGDLFAELIEDVPTS
jgi:RNA polymerase sigma-70 factor (ECF subfamily)